MNNEQHKEDVGRTLSKRILEDEDDDDDDDDGFTQFYTFWNNPENKVDVPKHDYKVKNLVNFGIKLDS